jgi:hypothetical protein
MAMEAVKLITGAGRPLIGRVLSDQWARRRIAHRRAAARQSLSRSVRRQVSPVIDRAGPGALTLPHLIQKSTGRKETDMRRFLVVLLTFVAILAAGWFALPARRHRL